MRISVLKYYSVTSGTLESCVKRLKQAQEKHPDREYTILRNMRGYGTRFVCAQVERVEGDFAFEDDLDLPAPLPRPPLHQADWSAYDRDQDKRQKAVNEARRTLLDAIKRKLNP